VGPGASGHAAGRRTGAPLFLAVAATLLAAAATAIGLASSTRAASQVRLRMSTGGFDPAALTLHKGETVTLVVESGDGSEHCFAIDELRIEKRVRPGRETRFDLTPERTGVFAMRCCLATDAGGHPERGELTVVE
jgi:heme/copper-type cytochrome/quinol oxidase subunit 2